MSSRNHQLEKPNLETEKYYDLKGSRMCKMFGDPRAYIACTPRLLAEQATCNSSTSSTLRSLCMR